MLRLVFNPINTSFGPSILVNFFRTLMHANVLTSKNVL